MIEKCFHTEYLSLRQVLRSVNFFFLSDVHFLCKFIGMWTSLKSKKHKESFNFLSGSLQEGYDRAIKRYEEETLTFEAFLRVNPVKDSSLFGKLVQPRMESTSFLMQF